jgi:hypothetical protein
VVRKKTLYTVVSLLAGGLARMDIVVGALIVTGASVLCGYLLVNEAYKHPLG